MSKINLETILVYQGDSERRPLVKELELKGVEAFFPELRFPSKAMTFLYGHANPGRACIGRIAGEQLMDYAEVSMAADIGNWLRQKVDFSDSPESGLASTRFFNVVRGKADVISALEKIAVSALGEAVHEDGFPRGATRHPYVLDSVMEDERFKHLAVIAYSVETKAVGRMQVASVFDLDVIVEFDRTSFLRDVELYLD